MALAKASLAVIALLNLLALPMYFLESFFIVQGVVRSFVAVLLSILIGLVCATLATYAWSRGNRLGAATQIILLAPCMVLLFTAASKNGLNASFRDLSDLLDPRAVIILAAFVIVPGILVGLGLTLLRRIRISESPRETKTRLRD